MSDSLNRGRYRIGCADLLGFFNKGYETFDLGNKRIKLLAVKVIVLLSLYPSDALGKLDSLVGREIGADVLTDMNKLRYGVEEFTIIALPPSDSVNLATEGRDPTTEEPNKTNSARPNSRLSCLCSGNALATKPPAVGEVGGSDPSSEGQEDNLNVGHWLAYLFLLVVSSGVAFAIGKFSSPNVIGMASPG